MELCRGKPGAGGFRSDAWLKGCTCLHLVHVAHYWGCGKSWKHENAWLQRFCMTICASNLRFAFLARRFTFLDRKKAVKFLQPVWLFGWVPPDTAWPTKPGRQWYGCCQILGTSLQDMESTLLYCSYIFFFLSLPFIPWRFGSDAWRYRCTCLLIEILTKHERRKCFLTLIMYGVCWAQIRDLISFQKRLLSLCADINKW